MNSKIEAYYQNVIEKDLHYLENSTIRKSLESYKKETERETAQLKNESDRIHNTEFLNSFYTDCISELEGEEEMMNEVIKNIILSLTHLKSTSFSDKIAEQIMENLENFELKQAYSSFNGLFFEYDTSPSFSGFAFKESKFEVILENPTYVDFEDGTYASDHSIEFELEELLEEILSEEFEEIAWQFEFELDIFQKIKDTAYHLVAINLHEALKTKELSERLNELGFEKGGVVYLNEHDMEVKSVFVNE